MLRTDGIQSASAFSTSGSGALARIVCAAFVALPRHLCSLPSWTGTPECGVYAGQPFQCAVGKMAFLRADSIADGQGHSATTSAAAVEASGGGVTLSLKLPPCGRCYCFLLGVGFGLMLGLQLCATQGATPLQAAFVQSVGSAVAGVRASVPSSTNLALAAVTPAPSPQATVLPVVTSAPEQRTAAQEEPEVAEAPEQPIPLVSQTLAPSLRGHVHHRRRRKQVHHGYSSVNGSSTYPPFDNSLPRDPKCAGLQQFRLQADGSVVAWGVASEASQIISPWSDISARNLTLRAETVEFINRFFAMQDNIFCRTPQDKQRLLMIRRDNGLGNSIQATVSYLVMAALTQRAVILVGWGDGLVRAFDTPLAAYTWESLSKHGLMSTRAMKAFYDCKKADDMDCFGISGDDQWMWCQSIDQHWNKRIVSVVGCCSNFIPLTLRNARYNAELVRAFGDSELAAPLYRVFFRPSKKAIVSKLKRPNEGQKYIAAQLRVFNPGEEKHLLDTAAACVEHLLALPEYEGASIFVAAVNNEIIKKFKKRLKHDVPVLQHKPPGSEYHGTEAWLGALQDIWVLGQADGLILTAWSSFGTLASALGGVTPWEIEGNMNSITGRCVRVLSPEPCSMRNWGPLPDHCPSEPAPVPLPASLDRRCGFDHGGLGSHPPVWKGVRMPDR
eukprot:TRINITY_DN2184_c1_g2_i2.p1 TRINITY_DN2184_c1_g2~~TRINITY_DN2184_c1_g2_i2.p1  ORF type:complete len:671 (+),score=76.47 TRINITY_DN2184_c1_g2_i2:21-2033(+)